jgi:predicted negative regulator of RcsB-dependent stress response
MEKKVAWLWFGGVAGFLFIGLLITLVNLNSFNYYQNQNYNNLPSLTETNTAPIEHYQEQVEKANTETEAISANESVAVNSTDANEYSYAGDLAPPFLFFNRDGTPNGTALILFVVVYTAGFFGVFGWRVVGFRVKSDIIGSAFFAVIVVLIFNMLQMTGLLKFG